MAGLLNASKSSYPKIERIQKIMMERKLRIEAANKRLVSEILELKEKTDEQDKKLEIKARIQKLRKERMKKVPEQVKDSERRKTVNGLRDLGKSEHPTARIVRNIFEITEKENEINKKLLRFNENKLELLLLEGMEKHLKGESNNAEIEEITKLRKSIEKISQETVKQIKQENPKRDIGKIIQSDESIIWCAEVIQLARQYERILRNLKT
ncbi:MAG: hypothetical protein ABH821_05415 [archaeon]